MRTVLAVLTLALVIAFATTSTASAGTTYRWSSTDRWAFIDVWAKFGKKQGYTYPYLFADCFQKVAARYYPSYVAEVRSPSHVWISSAAATRCTLLYGLGD
jgi:hypothetical protein